jgi:Pentapeptide repeats (8 copies)
LGRDNLGGSTQLQGADLTGAIWNGAILKGAEFDNNTKFPNGFFPFSHGMVEKPIDTVEPSQ